MVTIDSPVTMRAPALVLTTAHLKAALARVWRNPLLKVLAFVLAMPLIWLGALAVICLFIACELAPLFWDRAGDRLEPRG